MFNLRKKSLSKLDTIFLFSVAFLLILGFIILYSATLSLENVKMTSQIIATILGIFLMVLFSFMDLDFLKSLYIPIYILSIFLLILTLFFGVGAETWGSNSWLRLGGFSFQPAEFVKIGLIISFAKTLEDNEDKINQPKTLIKVLVFGFLPVVLILGQPDLGTAIVFIFFLCIMLFVSGISWKYILFALALFLVLLPFFYMKLDDFQKNRFLNFLNPERDMSDTGYQAIQGRIAVGSGKLFGRGYLKGTQTQYGFVPEKETDFIFSVIGEEFGFLGSLIVILLFFIMLSRMINIAENSSSSFGKYMVIGIAAMFLFHIFENIGMTIGIMPITGIPLPFFSYGGTFQMTNLIAVGLVISVNIQKSPLDFAPAKYRRWLA